MAEIYFLPFFCYILHLLIEFKYMSMKFNNILISIILMNPFNLRAQEISPENIDKLYKLAYEYYNTDQEKALDIVNKIIEEAKEIEYQKGLYDGYYLRGYIYESQRKIDQALADYFIAWEISLTENYKIRIIDCLTAIGKIYFTVGHYESAQVYYSDALAHSVNEKDTMNIISVYSRHLSFLTDTEF